MQIMRARTLLYAGLIALVGAIMLAGVLLAHDARDQRAARAQSALRLLSDGSIRNAYTVKILNKLHEPRAFSLAARGLAGARIRSSGATTERRVRVEYGRSAGIAGAGDPSGRRGGSPRTRTSSPVPWW